MADETSHQKEKSEPFFKCDVISLNPPRYRFTCLLAGYGLKGNNNCCRDKERVFQTESDKPRYDNLYRHLHTHTNGDFGVILKTFIESLNISHKTGLLTILSRISIRPHTPSTFGPTSISPRAYLGCFVPSRRTSPLKPLLLALNHTSFMPSSCIVQVFPRGA